MIGKFIQKTRLCLNYFNKHFKRVIKPILNEYSNKFTQNYVCVKT